MFLKEYEQMLLVFYYPSPEGDRFISLYEINGESGYTVSNTNTFIFLNRLLVLVAISLRSFLTKKEGETYI